MSLALSCTSATLQGTTWGTRCVDALDSQCKTRTRFSCPLSYVRVCMYAGYILGGEDDRGKQSVGEEDQEESKHDLRPSCGGLCLHAPHPTARYMYASLQECINVLSQVVSVDFKPSELEVCVCVCVCVFLCSFIHAHTRLSGSGRCGHC